MLEYHRVAEGSRLGQITPEIHIQELHLKRSISEISFLPGGQFESDTQMSLDQHSGVDSDEDDYIDQYGNDGAAMGGDNAHDFHQYNFLIEKFQSPLKEEENDEFQRFKEYLKGFELSDKDTLMNILNHLNETEAKMLQGLCKIKMV